MRGLGRGSPFAYEFGLPWSVHTRDNVTITGSKRATVGRSPKGAQQFHGNAELAVGVEEVTAVFRKRCRMNCGRYWLLGEEQDIRIRTSTRIAGIVRPPDDSRSSWR